MPVLRGRVASGLGDLAGWMSRYRLAYRDAVGTELHPGSLNVVLDQRGVMKRADVRLDAAAVGVDLGLVRCRIDDIGCWIVRTDRNNSGSGGHQLDVIEIVAPCTLGSVLDLKDGGEVAVLVEP